MLIDDLRRYLRRLAQDASLEEDAAPRGVPLFVSLNNDWWRMRIGGEPYVLAVSRLAELSPDDVVAQWNGLGQLRERSVLVLSPRDDAYCACLDAKGVGYIMPGARLSVPGKLMLVTRHIAAAKGPKGRMSVHAQLVVLWHLVKGQDGRGSFSDILAGAGVDKSHLSRAARELERLGLAQIDRSWRAHSIVFGKKDELWKRASALMTSPVLRRIRLPAVPSGLPTAGIEALSERTMLAPDEEPTYAVKRGDSRVDETKNTMYSGPTVEIWKYDPLIFSEDGRSVDSLSLWLSLRGETDPRVRKEMDLMMEAFKW